MDLSVVFSLVYLDEKQDRDFILLSNYVAIQRRFYTFPQFVLDLLVFELYTSKRKHGQKNAKPTLRYLCIYLFLFSYEQPNNQ